MTDNTNTTAEIWKHLPRGIRNNNPGNLEHKEGIDYLGHLATDPDGYCIFSHMFYGIRALGVDLRAKYELDNLRTVRSIITKYAPPEDNDTKAYIAEACSLVKYSPDDILRWPGGLHPLVFAITYQECGAVATAPTTFKAGIKAALAHEFK